MILKGDLLRRAQADRGRFRSLLLKSLQNFLIDAHEKARASKRGGKVHFVSLDDWMAEAPSRLTIPPSARELAAGAHLRSALGGDGRGAGAPAFAGRM